MLVFSPETPCFPGAGGQSRQYSLLSPLAGRHDIRVVSTGRTPGYARRPAGVEVREVPLLPPRPSAPGGWLRRNVRHVAAEPPRRRLRDLHELDTLAPVLGEEIAAFRPDVVQVEHGQLARLLASVPRGVGRVLVLGNMLVTLEAQALRTWRPRALAAGTAELLLAVREERHDLALADVVVTVSDADRGIARRLRPRASVIVVPNGIPVDWWHVDLEPAERPRVVMTASYNWPPNEDAARLLVTEVLPRLRRKVPGAELVLVGQGMPDSLAASVAASPGARATGTVDDVREEMRHAWVAVAPLRHGSGSPLKVMEAMAMGLPVVTAPRVATALALGDGEGIAVASSAAGWADALASLLTDPARREALGRRAAVVAGRFDAEAAALLMEEAWTRAARAAGGVPAAQPA